MVTQQCSTEKKRHSTPARMPCFIALQNAFAEWSCERGEEGRERVIQQVTFAPLLFSDDTGCPSSQSVSPVKTPPDTGNSPIAFCTGSDGGDYARKKFNSGTVADGTHQPARYKKEAKTNLIKPGKRLPI